MPLQRKIRHRHGAMRQAMGFPLVWWLGVLGMAVITFLAVATFPAGPAPGHPRFRHRQVPTLVTTLVPTPTPLMFAPVVQATLPPFALPCDPWGMLAIRQESLGKMHIAGCFPLCRGYYGCQNER